MQSVGIAAAVGTGVMLLIVLIVTIVRGVVEQYGTATFFVNQGFLSPILYGVTLAGFLTIGACSQRGSSHPRGSPMLRASQHDRQQQGQHHQQAARASRSTVSTSRVSTSRRRSSRTGSSRRVRSSTTPTSSSRRPDGPRGSRTIRGSIARAR